MIIRMSKPREKLMLLAIFLSNTIIMVDTILSPLYNNIYTIFGDHIALVNFALTGCYVIVIFLSLVVGKICDRFNKKFWLVIGAIFGTVGGVGMLFMTVDTMVIARVLLMIAYSITQPVAMAVLADIYADDDDRRGSVMGYYNASMSAIGIIFSFTAGILATYSLFSAYCLHLSIALYLLLLIFFVPSMKSAGKVQPGEAEHDEAPEAEAAPEDAALDDSPRAKGRLGGVFWAVNINFGFNALTYCAVVYFISVYVAENGLGTEAMSGMLLTMTSIIGFLVPLAYGWLAKRMGWATGVVGYLIQAIGILLMLVYPSVVMAFLGMGLVGGSNAIVRTDVMSVIAKVVPTMQVSFGFSLFVCIGTLATTLVTYFVTGGMAILSMTFTQFLLIPFIICAANVVIGFFVHRKVRKVDVTV